MVENYYQSAYSTDKLKTHDMWDYIEHDIENTIYIANRMKIFVKRNTIRIPFTSIRLIFEGGKYAGWYRFK